MLYGLNVIWSLNVIWPFLHNYIRNRTIRVGKFVHFFRAGWVTSIRGTLFGLMSESLVVNEIIGNESYYEEEKSHFKGTSYLKNGVSKSILHVIKHVNSNTVIWKR